jgi:outer membrane protein assembly factor BamA
MAEGVRGYARSDVENAGSRLAGGTAEWRFPILPDLNYYMWYFFPDFYFKAIFGTLFTDAGLVWDSPGEAARTQWHTVRNSVGGGIRIYTFILQEYPLVVSMDWAQRTTQNGGIFYVYLGQSF